MNECIELFSREATLKHEVWFASQANFIKFTTRRSEALRRSHERRGSSHALKTARVDFLCIFRKSTQTPLELKELGRTFKTL